MYHQTCRSINLFTAVQCLRTHHMKISSIKVECLLNLCNGNLVCKSQIKTNFLLCLLFQNASNNNNLMVNGRLSSGNSAPNVQSRWPPPRRILPQRQSSLPAAPLTPAGANAYQMHLNSQLPVAQPNSGSLRHISSSCVSSASNSRLLLNSRQVQSMPLLNFAFFNLNLSTVLLANSAEKQCSKEFFVL